MWLESERGGHVAMWLISSIILRVLVHMLQRLDSEGSWGRRRKFSTASLLISRNNVAGKERLFGGRRYTVALQGSDMRDGCRSCKTQPQYAGQTGLDGLPLQAVLHLQ